MKSSRLRDALVTALKKSSLSSRITGALFFIVLIITMLVPNYAHYLWTLILIGVGVLYAGSILIHTAIRMSKAHAQGLPRPNPFTAPLLVLLTAGIICIAYACSPNSIWSYNAENEPINQFTKQLSEIVNLPEEEAVKQIKALDRLDYFKIADVNYNLMVLDADGSVVSANTGWIGSSGQKLYPLVSPSWFQQGLSSEVRLMVLVNEQEQVIGTFLLDRNALSTSGSSAAYSSLTLGGDTQPPQTKLLALQNRYFPSFGNVIDKFTMQLWDAEDLYVTDPSKPYEGELANKEFDNRPISFYEWKGENIELMYGISGISYSQYGNLIFTKEDLIAELNALDDTQREALQAHVKWLGAAVADTTRTDHPRHALLFTSPSSGQQILLLYEDADGLYPMRQMWRQQMNIRNRVMILGILIAVLCWILLPFWVFADAKQRGHKHPALWGVLTMIGSIVALLIYNMSRPPMSVDKRGRKYPKGSCPLCGMPLKEDYIACPGCGILLRSKCKNCSRALENNWNFCPYCTQQILPDSDSSEETSAAREASSSEISTETEAKA